MLVQGQCAGAAAALCLPLGVLPAGVCRSGTLQALASDAARALDVVCCLMRAEWRVVTLWLFDRLQLNISDVLRVCHPAAVCHRETLINRWLLSCRSKYPKHVAKVSTAPCTFCSIDADLHV